MASLTRTRCSAHFSLLGRHNRISSTRKLVRLQIKETRCFTSTTMSYHSTGLNRAGASGRSVTGVGGRRMTTPHHLTLTLLTPPHLSPPAHRQLSSLSTIFNKMLTVNAAVPLPEDSSVTPPDPATLSATSQSMEESFSSLQAAAESIEYIPPPPAPPEVLAPALNALGEPTFQSLGLAGWTPVGLVQSVLENIHVTFDIPWWGTIAIATVIMRSLIFPLVLLSQRNAAKMHNNLPQLQILQMKMTEARNAGDQMNAARYGQEMVQFMKEKDLSPFKNIIVPLAQAPIFISMFMALRKLANLPVESFKDGGMLWFTDLTLCDPFYALPIITSLTMMATIELGADGAKLNSQNMHMMKYVLRALPIFIFPFTLSFPTAVLCYWVSTNAFSLVQVGFLKIPAVREYFNIEKSVSHKAETLPPKKGVVEGFQESWQNMKISKELNDRANYDEMRFKKAGVGPVVRTYKHDPTKVINVQAKVRDGK